MSKYVLVTFDLECEIEFAKNTNIYNEVFDIMSTKYNYSKHIFCVDNVVRELPSTTFAKEIAESSIDLVEAKKAMSELDTSVVSANKKLGTAYILKKAATNVSHFQNSFFLNK